MSQTRSIDEVRRSIASLVAEAEAAASVANALPGAGQRTAGKPSASQPTASQRTAGLPTAKQPSGESEMVDLSDPDEELPPAPPAPPAAPPASPQGGTDNALQRTARPLIEKWIADELPALAERLLRARLNQTRRD